MLSPLQHSLLWIAWSLLRFDSSAILNFMTIAIFGARGDMGKNLLVPLMEEFGTVIKVNRGDGADIWKSGWEADIILLAVPRDAIDELVRDVTFHSDQLVIDICSIKRNLSDIFRQKQCTHLSLHQLHGAHVPLQGQRWAVINTHPQAKNHEHAKELLLFLQNKGITFIDAPSEDFHDFMIGLTLSLPEMLTIGMDIFIEQYARMCKHEKPTNEQLMEWAVPASNALFSFYIHSINSSADWLRKDLILKAHGDMLQTARKSGWQLTQLTESQIENRLASQRKLTESLPKEERTRVRQWIERWFVDSTQKIFTFHQRKKMKPMLVIQEINNRDDVFPVQNGTITVGIHGIEGCFSHESALRLAEELKVNQKKLNLQYLVEAEEVIKAVVNGEVDRGVFAMANSGSGAYVTSMHPMGTYIFDVVAVYGMEILQCLIARPEIKSIDEIKKIFAHPQAVSQCRRTFAEKYPQIELAYGKDSDDTALCVKKLAQGEYSEGTATIASQIAAKRYGMNILEYGMHHDPFNTTTFLVIKKKL